MENEQKQPAKRVKLGGRAKGTPNKVTRDLRLRISDFLSTNFATLEAKMLELEPDAYCRTYTALLPYVMPRQKEIQATVSGGGGFAIVLPDNQRDNFNPADLDEL